MCAVAPRSLTSCRSLQVNLTRNLKAMAKMFPTEYAFCPKVRPAASTHSNQYQALISYLVHGASQLSCQYRSARGATTCDGVYAFVGLA